MLRVKHFMLFLLACVTFSVAGPSRLLGAQQSDAIAPEKQSANSNHEHPDQGPSESFGHWVPKLFRMMAPAESAQARPTNSQRVLSAFRGVVGLPSKSTVHVLCRGKQVALGTVVDSRGYIVTKSSELDGAVVCELADGSCYDAEVISVHRPSDLAMLKISAGVLPAVRWGDGDAPPVGSWAITPGTGSLPVAIGVVSVAPHSVRGGMLGIGTDDDDKGARIDFVVPGSGAAKAGLRRDDIVTHINGKPTTSTNELVATTGSLLPGDKIVVSILRNDKPQVVTAILRSVNDTLASTRSRFQEGLGTRLSKRRVLFPSALEHDSVLQPNECGGPLVDVNGQVIGINIARASRISSYALPAAVVRPLLESLKHRTTTPVSHEAVASGSQPEPGSGKH